MRGVTPCLGLRGRVTEAPTFYGGAFGARDLERMPDPESTDRLMQWQVEFNAGDLMGTDRSHGGCGDADMHPQPVVAGGRSWSESAVAAGRAVEATCERQSRGDGWGLPRDPFGIGWTVLQTEPETIA
jgi:PhnB protein